MRKKKNCSKPARDAPSFPGKKPATYVFDPPRGGEPVLIGKLIPGVLKEIWSNRAIIHKRKRRGRCDRSGRDTSRNSAPKHHGKKKGNSRQGNLFPTQIELNFPSR